MGLATDKIKSADARKNTYLFSEFLIIKTGK